MGECDSTKEENLMPGVVPPAQGGHRPGGRPPGPAGARAAGPDREDRTRARPSGIPGDDRPNRQAAARPAAKTGGKTQVEKPGWRRPGAVGGAALPAAAAGSPFAVGQDVEVVIADVAQGGWCVARPDGLPVMFVRHALPGERVVARVTEVTSKFARADAIQVL
jgi:predicted RNA-binding protein with TRAM domain